MIFQIRVADLVIELTTYYRTTFQMCGDYLCKNQKPDIYITIYEDDFKKERIRVKENALKNGYEKQQFSDEYLETLIIYRKITEKIVDFNRFMVHGSVVATPAKSGKGDIAVMFAAKSGTGKTTRTLMWLEQISNSYVVNGDKPLLKITDDGVLAYGTPWAGKEKFQRNTSAPLKAIFLLERAENNSVKELSLSAALPLLIKQTQIPEVKDGIYKVLQLFNEMAKTVKFYRLRSNLDSEVIELVHSTVFGASNVIDE